MDMEKLVQVNVMLANNDITMQTEPSLVVYYIAKGIVVEQNLAHKSSDYGPQFRVWPFRFDV